MGRYEPRLSNRTAEDSYRAFDYQYTPWPHIDDTEANRNMLVRVCTREFIHHLKRKIIHARYKEHVNVTVSHTNLDISRRDKVVGDGGI